ncbi:MAG TPA: hypothetical protein VLI39_09105 [Sedimentisphaerales bacterium]|nr:hypothetical protein [Sedimentisphaerales bacterium]
MKSTNNSQDSLGTTTMPLLLSASGVGKLLGVSVRTVWNLHQDGQLGPLPVRLRGATRWKSAEIESWVSADCPNRERWLAVRKGR